MTNWNECVGWHSHFLPCLVKLKGSLSVLYPHQPGLWSSVFLYLFTLTNRQNSEKLMRQQMIKLLARPTNNAEQFCGQRKEGNFKCQHFTKFCAALYEIFDFHWFNLLSFVICFSVVELILFWQNIKLGNMC